MVASGANSEELQALVGRALVDPTFRKDLLNGPRVECRSECALTNAEFDAALAALVGARPPVPGGARAGGRSMSSHVNRLRTLQVHPDHGKARDVHAEEAGRQVPEPLRDVGHQQ